MTITTLDLIRHGEPVGGRKYRGQIDDPLSEKGWQQMRDAVGDHRPWSHIVSSPLSRCIEFARELSERHELQLSVDHQLKEIGFGAWEGKSVDQIEAETPGLLQQFYADPINNRPQGAEPLRAFKQRISSAMQNLLESHQGKHILIVCHAGVMRMTMLHFLGIPLEHVFRIQVDNAGITRIAVDHYKGQQLPRLIFHGGRL